MTVLPEATHRLSQATSGRCFFPSLDSASWTGEAIHLSRTGRPSLPTMPKLRVPVGQLCTHAEQRTHSGSRMGSPLLAKLMMSMPWWQTDVHTLQEMHFFLSAKIRNFVNARAYRCMS